MAARDERNHDRGRREEQHRAPADRGREQEPGHSREADADRFAGLQQGRRAAAHPAWRRLGEQRVADRPFAADAEARDQAENQDRPIPGRARGECRANRVDENRPGHHRAAAVLIGQVAEQDAADAGSAERDAEQHGLFEIVEPEIAADRNEQEGEQDEVVEIEHPAGERDEPDAHGKAGGASCVGNGLMGRCHVVPRESARIIRRLGDDAA